MASTPVAPSSSRVTVPVTVFSKVKAPDKVMNPATSSVPLVISSRCSVSSPAANCTVCPPAVSSTTPPVRFTRRLPVALNVSDPPTPSSPIDPRLSNA